MPLEKVTIRLFQGQMDRLRELHGHKINPNKLIRTIIAAYIQRVETRAAETLPSVDELQIETDEDGE